MEPDFWHAKWAAQTLGFHLSTVNPNLEQLVGRLPAPPARILIPMCGKSVDLPWLAARGHAVLGVELNASAVEAFFEESGLSQAVEVSDAGALRRHRAERVEMLQGDMFDLTAEHVGRVDAVYDRAALIALPAAMRTRYAQLLTGLLPPGATYLLITLEIPGRESGPPFSVEEAEVRALYGDRFTIEVLDKQVVGGDDKFAGSTEGRYLLTRLSP